MQDDFDDDGGLALPDDDVAGSELPDLEAGEGGELDLDVDVEEPAARSSGRKARRVRGLGRPRKATVQKAPAGTAAGRPAEGCRQESRPEEIGGEEGRSEESRPQESRGSQLARGEESGAQAGGEEGGQEGCEEGGQEGRQEGRAAKGRQEESGASPLALAVPSQPVFEARPSRLDLPSS